MNIAFVISEVEDIVKTGGLADVGKALPHALNELGHDVRIFMPFYKKQMSHIKNAKVIHSSVLQVNKKRYPYRIFTVFSGNTPVYLIEHEYFSSSSHLYTDETLASNAQKFSFFSLCVIHSLVTLMPDVDVVHSNDWHTSMVSYFINSHYFARHKMQEQADLVAKIRCVLSIHNAAFQGIEAITRVPVLDTIDTDKVSNHNGYLNMLKTGILFADHICAVSPTYARELTTELGSHGIHDVINRSPQKLNGILNGCDYEQWDPATDQYLTSRYSVNDLRGKVACKKQLQKKVALKVRPQVPLFGMVCRATKQKGFDYLLPVLEEFLLHDVQMVIMGTGESRITDELRRVCSLYPDKFQFKEEFSNELAHLIEAGSDFFLMPSEFEPCGLNQMYSLAYGTLPIVRKVGGLADTVTDISQATPNGFLFEQPSSLAFINCLRKALLVFIESPEKINQMKTNAMNTRFLWADAATKYEQVYQQPCIGNDTSTELK